MAVNLSMQDVRYGQAMAAVLDAMVPYVKKLIAGMAEEEVNMLLGVSGQSILIRAFHFFKVCTRSKPLQDSNSSI